MCETPVKTKHKTRRHKKRKGLFSTKCSPCFKSARALDPTEVRHKKMLLSKRTGVVCPVIKKQDHCAKVWENNNCFKLIVMCLPVKDILSLSCINRKFKKIVYIDRLWKLLTRRDFGVKFTELTNKSVQALDDCYATNANWRAVLLGNATATVTQLQFNIAGKNKFCYSQHRVPHVLLSQENIAIALWLGANHYRRYLWCTRCRLNGLLQKSNKKIKCLASASKERNRPRQREHHRVKCYLCSRKFCPCTELQIGTQNHYFPCQDYSNDTKRSSCLEDQRLPAQNNRCSLAHIIRKHLTKTFVFRQGTNGEFDVDVCNSDSDYVALRWKKPFTFNGNHVDIEQSGVGTILCLSCGYHTCGECYHILKCRLTCCAEARKIICIPQENI